MMWWPSPAKSGIRPANTIMAIPIAKSGRLAAAHDSGAGRSRSTKSR